MRITNIMPCSCEGYEASVDRDRLAELYRLEALACAMVRAEPGILDKVDYNEAGVPMSWALNWWADHQKRDQARQTAAEIAKQIAAKKQAALAKLTPAERDLLGVK